MSDTQIGKFQFRVLAGAVVLLNLYAGGCVTHEIGPFEAALAFAVTPSLILDFLIGGLVIYVIAIGLLGLVLLPLRLFAKRSLNGEAFLVWSTAINFFIVAIVGAGST